MIFDLSGLTANQRGIVEEAIIRSNFDYDRLIPGCMRVVGRGTIIVECVDIQATYGYSAGGLAWKEQGKITLSTQWESDREFTGGAFISEAAHMVDFYLLTDQQRNDIFALYCSRTGAHANHHWLGQGPYTDQVGESFMEGFKKAYTDYSVSSPSGFSHESTDEIAFRISIIIDGVPMQPGLIAVRGADGPAGSTGARGSTGEAGPPGEVTGALMFGRRPGQWYGGTMAALTTTVGTIGIGDAYAIPIFVQGAPLDIDQLGVVVDSGTGVARIGLYSDAGYGYPGEFMGIGGSFSITQAGLNSRTVDVTLQPGLYWLVLIADYALDPAEPGVSFDGADDYIGVPSGALIPSNTITIEFWAKGGTQLPKDTTLFWATQSNGTRTLNIELPWGNQNLVFDCGSENGGNNYDRIEQAMLPSEMKGSWRFWAFTKSATARQMKVYLDGNLWLEGEVDGWPMPTSTFFQIGHQGAGATPVNPWHGRLRDIRIFTPVRTAAQIAQDMNGITGLEDGLRHWWKIDEGEGSTLNDSGPGNLAATLYGPKWGTDAQATYVRHYNHLHWPLFPMDGAESVPGCGYRAAGIGQGLPGTFPVMGVTNHYDMPKMVFRVAA